MPLAEKQSITSNSRAFLTLRRYSTLLAAFVPLTLLSAGILVFFIVPFFGGGTLWAWDHLGHLFSAKYLAQHYFPLPHGWNPEFLWGTMQGRHYPPLFHWLVAGFAQLFTVETAYRIIVSASELLLIPAAFFLFRAYSVSALLSTLGTIALFALRALSQEPLGANIYSTFWIGNAPHQLGYLGLLVYLALLPKLLRGKAFVLPTAVAAAVVLTHFVSAFLIGAVAAAALLDRRHEFGATFRILFRHLLLVAVLCGFWLVPLLFTAGAHVMTTGTFRPSLWQTVLLAVPLLHLLPSIRPALDSARPLAIAVLLLVIFMIVNSALGDPFPFHYLRSTLSILTFALVCGVVVIDKCVHITAGEGALYSCAALVAISISLSQLPLPIQHRAPLMVPPMQCSAGRVLGLPPPVPFYSFHRVHYVLPFAGMRRMSKGLFLESSALSPAAIVLEDHFARKIMSRRAETWGGLPLRRSIPPRILSGRRERGMLRRLDISCALLMTVPAKGFPERFQRRCGPGEFCAVPLGKTSTVEIVQDPLQAVSPQSFDSMNITRLRTGRTRPLLVAGALPRYSREPSAAVEIARQSETGDEFDLIVRADGDVPVLVKTAWDPGWRVRDEQHALQTFRAAPGFLLFFGHGKIKVRRESTWDEWFGAAISLLGVLALIRDALGYRARQKR